MSKLQVDTIVDKEDVSAPTLSKGAIVTGVTTSTSFAGALTGDVTGNITGNQSGGSVNATTGDFSSKVTVSTDVNVSGTSTVGVLTATSAVVGSAVTSNADGIVAAGIVTAGTCFKTGDGVFGAGIGATITGAGDAVFAGICTATSFEGDVSNCTGAGVGANDSVNTTGIITATTFVPTVGQLSNRNLMINGAMQVAQRQTSTTTSGDYAADRYRLTFTGTDEAATMAQVALTSSDTGPWAAGFRYASQITYGNQTSGAGAADNVFMKYKFEAQELAQSGWDYTSSSSYVTLSFWIKSSVAQNFYGWIVTDDGTQQNFPFETGSLSADTWTKVTKAIPGNSNITITNDNTAGLALHLVAFQGTDYTDSGVALDTWAAYASGTRTPDFTSTWYTTDDATFAFTGFQLEVGSVDTPFEHRTYADDLIKCQRYYFRFGGTQWSHVCMGIMASTTQVRATIQFPVTMRAVPASGGSGMYVDSETTASQNITAFDDTYLMTTGGQLRMTTDTLSGGGGTVVNVGLDHATTAYFDCSAEL